MKLTKLAAVASVTSILLLAGLSETIVNIKPASAQNAPNSTIIAKKGDTLSTGNFVTVDKSTRGGVKIIEKNGRRYVELASNFRTARGPALEVILHRNRRVSKAINEGDYVSLATLRRVNGTQRYLIPNNVNLNDFESVAIWCEEFNVTFGYASI
ncbi:MAG: DM13 domain-containing protein [Prochloraceae cyanobacterium]